MSDNKSKTGPADDQRINVHQEHEVRYWTQKLGCTKQQLVDAVSAAGVMVTDVQRHLGK
jgi:hypothetical protein